MKKLSILLQKELKQYRLSAQQKVFADLVDKKYSMKDAYILSGLYDDSKSDSSNNNDMNKFVNESPAFANYMAYLDLHRQQATVVRQYEKKEEEKPKVSMKSVKLEDKESAIRELESLLPDLEGKERADVIMKITDLRGWKKEVQKEEIELVKYFLPLSCNNCSLYLKAQKK